MFPLTLPNALTVLRILLVPVIVVALLEETPNGDTLAAIVFAAAAFTDGLDGYIARSRGSITTFGKLMDPLADKLLIIASLVSLVSLDRIAAWVAMVIIAREFAVTALRMIAVEQGVVIAASWLGKAKTVLQVGAIFGAIAFHRHCAGCHSMYTPAASVGPTLRGVVGRRVGSTEFGYSSALSGRQEVWTISGVLDFAQNPASIYPGTRMPAVKMSPKDRKLLESYLVNH